MSTVALIEVTRANVRDVCRLELGPGQDKMVAHAAQTVAEANYHNNGSLLRAIVEDDRPVGVLWALTEEPDMEAPYLVRFMIDHGHQRHGLGRRAVRLLLDELRARGHTTLELSYVPIPGGAEGFWLRCGFEPTGREHGGENVVRIDIR
ncbi:MAG TPA: GNAT family N-acetyltransferase [Baekduia sp.]